MNTKVRAGIILLLVGFFTAAAIGYFTSKAPDTSKPQGMALVDAPMTIIANAQQIIDAARICNQQYDYPGCTVEQQRALEAPTKAEFNRNYDKNRWGGGNNEWANLSDANNDRLRGIYNDAVDAYQGTVVYATWKDYKDHTRCLSTAFRGPLSQQAAAWCQINEGINKLFDPVRSFVFLCSGRIVGGALAGGALAGPLGVTIPFGAATGAAGGAIECGTETLWNKLWDIGPGKHRQEVL